MRVLKIILAPVSFILFSIIYVLMPDDEETKRRISLLEYCDHFEKGNEKGNNNGF